MLNNYDATQPYVINEQVLSYIVKFSCGFQRKVDEERRINLAKWSESTLYGQRVMADGLRDLNILAVAYLSSIPKSSTPAGAGKTSGGGTGSGSPQPISGTSYSSNALYKTQPSSYLDLSAINNIKASIQSGGPNSVSPITVHVHNCQALVVDGHHRLQAFIELGYTRVQIKYIHSNQISRYTVMTLGDLIEYAYK